MKDDCVKEKIVAMIVFLIIAIFSMYLLKEPANVVINIITAIAAFITGERIGQVRKTDVLPEK